MVNRNLLAVLLSGVFLVVDGCSPKPQPSDLSTRQLLPLNAPVDPTWKSGRTYVPIYSTLALAFDNQSVDLGATLSIRNVSLKNDLIVESVDYYDSAGTRIRRYLEQPARLGPMASTEMIVSRLDRTGGAGANFLVDWVVPPSAEDPFIEAVMIGQTGNAGISFTSPGRTTVREK